MNGQSTGWTGEKKISESLFYDCIEDWGKENTEPLSEVTKASMMQIVKRYNDKIKALRQKNLTFNG